jgi:hypothetical protein
MADLRRGMTAPWIVSAVAGAVLIATLIVYFVALRPAEGKVVGALTDQEQAAVNAAAQEATNVLSYTRAHFATDFQRALDGATGAMRTDLSGKKSAILDSITKGKFDLAADVTHKALEGPTGSGKSKGYLVLVTLNGYRSTAKDQPTPSDLEVTVVRSGGKWLVSQITSIGVS